MPKLHNVLNVGTNVPKSNHMTNTLPTKKKNIPTNMYKPMTPPTKHKAKQHQQIFKKNKLHHQKPHAKQNTQNKQRLSSLS